MNLWQEREFARFGLSHRTAVRGIVALFRRLQRLRTKQNIIASSLQNQRGGGGPGRFLGDFGVTSAGGTDGSSSPSRRARARTMDLLDLGREPGAGRRHSFGQDGSGLARRLEDGLAELRSEDGDDASREKAHGTGDNSAHLSDGTADAPVVGAGADSRASGEQPRGPLEPGVVASITGA